jgi:hypothetical protein
MALGAREAPRANADGRTRRRSAAVTVAAIGSALAAGGFVTIPLQLDQPFAGHAYAACILALSTYGALHAGLATIGSLFVAARCRAGYLSARRPNEVLILRLWCSFTVVAGLVTLAAILLPAWLWTA